MIRTLLYVAGALVAFSVLPHLHIPFHLPGLHLPPLVGPHGAGFLFKAGVCAGFAWLAWKAWKANSMALAWGCGILAVLMNPFFPIHVPLHFGPRSELFVGAALAAVLVVLARRITSAEEEKAAARKNDPDEVKP